MPPDGESELALRPTLGFICPLYKELQAVVATFDSFLGREPIYSDGDIQCEYHYGRVGSRIAVALSFYDHRVGPKWAVYWADRLLEKHKSLRAKGSFCFLVGIAAGVWSRQQDVRLGDVVIATEVVDWTSGKFDTNHGFQSSEHPQDASKFVLLKVGAFCNDPHRLGERISERVTMMQPPKNASETLWNHPGSNEDVLFHADVVHEEGQECDGCERRFEQRSPRPNQLPKVHSGLIAAGDVVLKDAHQRESLNTYRNNQVLAVEMEASGVTLAHKRFIVIRGISDYADSHKNDQWQHHAAATAAACARLFIDDCILEDYLEEDDGRQSSDDPPSGHGDITSDGSSEADDLAEMSQSISGSDDECGCHANQSVNASMKTGATPPIPADARIICVRRDSSHEGWKSLLEVETSSVSLCIREDSNVGDSALVDWQKSIVAFEIKDRNEQHDSVATRRIRISGFVGDSEVSHVLWLPHTQVRVLLDQSRMTFDFSNCNKRQRAKQENSRFETVNGQVSYKVTYDPSNPNVHLELDVKDREQAKSLSDLILCRDHLDNGSPKDFQTCKVVRSAKSAQPGFSGTVYCWQTASNSEVLDIAYFRDKVDFHLCPTHGTVRLGYAHKFVYEPINVKPFPTEPPLEVKENHDGQPGKTQLGDDLLSSALCINVSQDEVCRLLSEIVGLPTGWKMCIIAKDVIIVLNNNQRRRSKLKIDSVQLAACTNEWGSVRLYIRLPTEKTPKKTRRWIMCTVPDCESEAESPEAQFKYHIEGDNCVILEGIKIQNGDYLTLKELLPASEEGTKSDKHIWNTVSLEFQNASEQAAVEDLIKSRGTMTGQGHQQ